MDVINRLGLMAVIGVWLGGCAANQPKERRGVDLLRDWNAGRLPITLIVDSDMEDSVVDAVGWAIEFWAKSVPDIRLFSEPGEVTRSGIVVPVLMSHTMNNRAIAVTRVTFGENGVVISAAVYIGVDAAHRMSAAVIRRAIAHELGHVLGLAHNDSPDSVMFWLARDGEPLVLEGEANEVRSVYGGAPNEKVVDE